MLVFLCMFLLFCFFFFVVKWPTTYKGEVIRDYERSKGKLRPSSSELSEDATDNSQSRDMGSEREMEKVE
jgi:hypothetical protein